MTKTAAMLELEQQQGRDIRDLLKDAYAREGSTIKAGMRLGISGGAFSTWVMLLGGEIRSTVEFPAEETVACGVAGGGA